MYNGNRKACLCEFEGIYIYMHGSELVSGDNIKKQNNQKVILSIFQSWLFIWWCNTCEYFLYHVFMNESVCVCDKSSLVNESFSVLR